MSWKIRPLVLGAVLLGAARLAAAQSAPASDEATLDNDPCLTDAICRAHFQRGRKLSKEDNYSEALAAYESAHLRREVPWLLINIGRTLHKLGRPAESVKYYERYLTDEPHGPPDRKQRAEQFEQEAKEEVAKLDALKKTEAVPVVAEPTAPVVKDSPQPSVSGDVPARVSVPAAKMPAASPPGRPAWLWAGVGAGGAVVVIGAVVGVAALTQASSAKNAVYVGEPSAEAMNAQKNARALGIATDVLLGAGVIAVGVTAVTYLVKHRKKERVALLPSFQLGTRLAGVGLSGSY